MASSKKTQIVYSTAVGRTCPVCGERQSGCRCQSKTSTPKGDGVVRVRREVKGRRGKTVTTIAGVPVSELELLDIAAQLKKKCGTGGSVKDGVIVIQGDKTTIVIMELQKLNFMVKKSGG